jgi:hypothetical protein
MLNLQRNLRKLNLVIIVGLLSLLLINNNTIYAYWNSVETSLAFDSITITIGEWGNIYDDIMQLDSMTEEELKQPIPDDTLFMYQGKLYIKRPSETYIPFWHGMPGEPSSRWAVFALNLEWIPNTNYRNNSVVIRNGKYYITNTNHNNNWFIEDPADSKTQWDPWLEIEPISEEHFGYLEGTSLRDYSNPDFNFIVYK